MSIRRLLYSEHAEIRSFVCANEGEEWTGRVEQLIQNDLLPLAYAGDGDFVVLVAACDQGVVGLAVYAPLDNVEKIMESKIVAVRPERRREYIGINLKQRVMDNAIAAGYQLVFSEVYEENSAMHLLNQKLLAETQPEPDEFGYMQTMVKLQPEVAE